MLTGTSTFFGFIKNVYKIKDSEGIEHTVYGDGSCELLTRELDGKIISILGPHAGMEIKGGHLQILTVGAAISVTGKTNINEIRKELEEMNKESFFEVVDGKATQITDEYILTQIGQIIIQNSTQLPGDSTALIQQHKSDNVRTEYPKISEAYNKIIGRIIGQDQQVKAVLSSIYNNMFVSSMDLTSEQKRELKQNILMFGPTGTGKTETVQQIANELNIPISIEDATTYSATGYVGGKVDDIFAHLLSKCDGDLEKAQHGIIVIDEIDKLSNPNADGNDVSKTDVQDALLKLLEGGIRYFEVNRKPISFNADGVTIIGLGAFAGIEKLKNNSVALNKPIGFNCASFNNNTTTDKNKKEYTAEEFSKYGFKAELLGRFTQVVEMNPLDKDALKLILLNSEISPLKMNQIKYQNLGINFNYDDSFIDAICEEALKGGCGARNLKKIIEKAIFDGQFEIFDNSNFTSFNLTGETVKNPKQYVLK